ncbi:MAG: ABC transporter ATP-binding protein/permease [Planctomycetes bacterium]|nr:ABC transporter ATP-binding protein/permease [Planctomycetota bacterium]
MTPSERRTAPPSGTLPEAWRAAVDAQLLPEETVQTWFQTDLNSDLTFAPALVVLTNHRLIGTGFGGAEASAAWGAWQLNTALKLVIHDEAGVGILELMGPERRLAYWRYTPARAASAAALARVFESTIDPSGAALHNVGGGICPSCGRQLAADEIECPDCAPAAVAPVARSLLALAQFARPRAGLILLGLLLTMAGTAAGLAPPLLTMGLVDNVLTPRIGGQPADFQLVYWYLGGFAAAAVVAWLLSWARTYVLAFVSERIAADLRDRTYTHLQRLSLEFFGGKRTGDLIARVGSDSDRLCNFMSVSLVDFVTDVFVFLMTSVVLFWIDPLLALVVLLPLPLIAWMIQLVRHQLRRGFGQGYAAWAEMISVLADTIPGVRVVKAFAQEKREIERFSERNEHVRLVNNRVNRVWSFFEPMIALLTDLGLLVVWLFGAWRVVQGEILLGVLIAFVTYISRFYGRLQSMSRMVASTQRAAASAHRIFEILDREPSVREPSDPVPAGRVRGDLELRNIWFQYGSRPVIKGISLSVKSGELIGLVGPSGAGKSTLINLICRFYDVAQGAILVDGTDIRRYRIADYRQNIGIVLQDPFLFFGTIAENIAYGKPSASRAEIVAAARAAHAHEFILKLPDGYDSLVGERGQTLSGGERQRISIARALLIDPRILILDEATSSVDTETEWLIQQALDNLIRGRTTFAIAHRLSTLRRADRLVVVEDGQITETGRHDDLLAHSGTYMRLYQAQLRTATQQAADPVPSATPADELAETP